jgi:sulfatase modifying factor 1
VLLFPLIAASLVLSVGADASPALGLASAAGTTDQGGGARANETEPSLETSSSRGAKRPAARPRIRPKPTIRRRPMARASRQTIRKSDALAEATVLGASSRQAYSVCPSGMATIASYCIDQYEASLVQVSPDGQERPWPYYEMVSSDVVVRAVSEPGVYPQGYVSGVEAAQACDRSGKRLCKPDEWRNACMGPRATVFPYGDSREVGRCNDNGRSSMRFFNPKLDSKPEHRWMWGFGGNMADPRLNQLDGTLTRTGERAGCTNEYGVFDMVGNLHEWVDDPDGTFQGGYYLDTHLNGDGCYYRTTAHPVWHRDYSTGFRCCADLDH